MPIYIRTVDGRTERVRTQQEHADDEAAELDRLLRGTGHPYQAGWVEIAASHPQFIALRHIVSAEIRAEGEL